MKRLLITLPELADRQNLLLATWKAARGRQQRPVVVRFLATLDQRLDKLAASILAQTAPQGRMRRFTIFDPKQRQITAACFADRVLHHALLNLAEPRFEAALVPSSFACRPGLGVHAAVATVQRNLQRWPWWVQVDVAGYFPSIDHGLLMAMLARRFKGADHLALWQRIIASGVPQGGGLPVGLPIGALTSQHLANAYLDAADRFLLGLPEVLSVWPQRHRCRHLARIGNAPTMPCTPRWPTPTAGGCASGCGHARPACTMTMPATWRRLVKVAP